MATLEETTFGVAGRTVHATIGRPPGVRADASPGLVLVEGSGPSSRHDQRGWVLRMVGALGCAVLVHDKAGCGDTAGSWLEQSIPDRASEAIAAVAHLTDLVDVDSGRVGVWGASQGGWVVLESLARGLPVAGAMLVSTPGVTPFAQEVVSLRQRMRRAGVDPGHVAATVDGFAALVDRLAVGDPADEVAAGFRMLRGRPGGEHVYAEMVDPRLLEYFARIGHFDPVARLREVRCPVLAIWGAEDDVVPVEASRATFEEELRIPPEHVELHVVPGADHHICVGPLPGDPAMEPPFASGYLATMRDWFHRTVRDRDAAVD